MVFDFLAIIVLLAATAASFASDINDIVDTWTPEDFDSFYKYIDYWLRLNITNSRDQQAYINRHKSTSAIVLSISVPISVLVVIVAAWFCIRHRRCILKRLTRNQRETRLPVQTLEELGSSEDLIVFDRSLPLLPHHSDPSKKRTLCTLEKCKFKCSCDSLVVDESEL